jgi:hypothetical protein
LLLRELLKHTPKESPDYSPVEKAQQFISEIVSTINKKISHSQKIQEIKLQFGFLPVSLLFQIDSKYF